MNIVLEGDDGNNNLAADPLKAATIYAKAGADTLSGSNFNDELYGEDGNDLLSGNAGNDKLFGGMGDDTLHAGEGLDLLDGGEGNDTLYGNTKPVVGFNSTLQGGAGDDKIFNNHASGVISGGDGNDQIFAVNAELTSATPSPLYLQIIDAGAGNDYIQISMPAMHSVKAGEGNDTIIMEGNANGVVSGDAGHDRILLRSSAVASGGEGNDTIISTGSSGVLNGNSGNDLLIAGQKGNYWLNGGADNDLLIVRSTISKQEASAMPLVSFNKLQGDGGADVFAFQAGSQYFSNQILDFKSSEGDKIDLSNFQIHNSAGELIKHKFTGIQNGPASGSVLGFEIEFASQNWGTIKGELDGLDFRIDLQNVTSLSASDFIF